MYENICYKKPFLVEAVVRFDFASQIPEFEKGLPARVSTAALKKFPIFEPQKTQLHELQFGDAVEAKSSVTEIINLIYHGLEKEKTLNITPNSLDVTIKNYHTFELFMEDVLAPLSALCEAFPELRASRVGIRYVNVINLTGGNPLDWNDYVNPKLIGVIDFHEKENLSRAFQMLEYNFEEDATKFQFGLVNPDYPAKIKRREFVLDIDAFSVGAFDYQGILGKINKGHERIQELFESSITQTTRENMKVVNNAG